MGSDSSTIDADNNPFGLVLSQNYPTWEANSNHARVIRSQNPNKAIRFYITDIDIEDPSGGRCLKASLDLNDGVSLKFFNGYP